MEIGLTDPAQIRTYSEKRKTAQKELREFVSAHPELRRDPWKEKIHGIVIDNSSKKNIMIADIKRESGIRGELHLSPSPIDAENLSFDFTHTNKERMHNVTESEAKCIIQDANFSVSVWDGKFERYYAEKGTAFVDMQDRLIRTAFKEMDFDEREKHLGEVLKQYGK